MVKGFWFLVDFILEWKIFRGNSRLNERRKAGVNLLNPDEEAGALFPELSNYRRVEAHAGDSLRLQ